MGKRGVKRKPTNLRLLEGTPTQRKPNGTEPKPANTKPGMPTWLGKEAKEIWGSLSQRLERCGLLTEVDGPVFGILCHVLSQYIKYARLERKDIDSSIESVQYKTASGQFVQRSSYAMMAKKYLTDFRLLAADFGLSPADRAELQRGNFKKENEESLLD